MGSSDFALPSLERLLERDNDLLAVVTSPDLKQGRGMNIQFSPVKLLAVEHKIPVLQPLNLRDNSFIHRLRLLCADVFIVVAFKILPEDVLNIPAKGSVNLHASLLPNYRGAAPINWSIINGEKKTGITTFFIKKKVDTGDIILQESEIINDSDTFGSLSKRLMIKGADLLVKTMKLIEEGNSLIKKQDNLMSHSKAPKIYTKDCYINLSMKCREVYNLVRGLSPYPGAWISIDNTVYKIFFIKIVDSIPTVDSIKNSVYCTDNDTFFYLLCADGYISIEEIQQESKKRMNIRDFLRGKKFS